MKLPGVRTIWFLIAGLCLVPFFVSADLSLVLGWDESPDSEVVGYRLHIGNDPTIYTRVIDVGLSTQAVADGLEWDTLYYFAVSAYDASSREGELSEPIAYRTPQAPVVTVEPPVIHKEPIDQLVMKGGSTTIAMEWTGSSPLISQWYKGDLPLNDGPDFSGVNSSRLTILNADETSEGLYYAILSNPSGSVKSKPAYVHVLNEPKIESVVSLGNGTSRITIANEDGSQLAASQVFRITVLASTNPTPDSAWLPLTNAMTLSDGTLRVQDIHVLNYPQRYYRTLITGSSIGSLKVEHPQRLENGGMRIGVRRADGMRGFTPAEAGRVRIQSSYDPQGTSGWNWMAYPIRLEAERLVLDDNSAAYHLQKFYRAVATDEENPGLQLEMPLLKSPGLLELAVKRADGLPLNNSDVYNYQVFVSTNLSGTPQWTLLTHPMSYSNGNLTIDDTNAASSALRFYRVFAR